MATLCSAILAGYALFAIGGLRGCAIAVTVNDMPKVDERDEYLGRGVFVEVLGLPVSIIALILKIPHHRSPTGMTTIRSAILFAYALFANGGLRGSADAVTVKGMTKVAERGEYLGRCALVEVLALLVSIIALVSKIPHRRSHTGMTTIRAATVFF